MVLGSIISAGADLIGGVLDRSESKDRASFQNDAARRAAARDRQFQREMFDKNEELQKEFAQHGVRWKVSDAKAAGIHPLYAMGAPTVKLSPISVGGSSTSIPSAYGGSSFGDSLARAGQDIGRAIDATRSKEERAAARAATRLTLERGELENQLLRAQISKISRSQVGPPFPSARSASSGEVITLPSEVVTQDKGQQPGKIAYYKKAQTPGGYEVVVPSDDMVRIMESDPLQIPAWYANMAVGAVADAGQRTGRYLRSKWDEFWQ